MEPTLDAALGELFATSAGPAQAAAPAAQNALQPALEQARKMLDEAEKAMQQGDWTKFGSAMQGLERQLGGPRAH